MKPLTGITSQIGGSYLANPIVFNTPTNHQYRFIKDRAVRNDLYTTVIKFGISGAF